MNIEQNGPDPALNALVRAANEKAIASVVDPELDRLIAAIKSNVALTRRAVREVGAAGYQRHLAAQGFDIPLTKLKRGLIVAGVWRARARKK